ncbi:hypothetical protein LXA43DRAFT_1168070 [Ganoderma leucocontextum]|nr:hypothetical protein LXA43DRAFT_1168070 [Ganoderma leucocontextum]
MSSEGSDRASLFPLRASASMASTSDYHPGVVSEGRSTGVSQSGTRRDPVLEYIVLNRNCLRDIRDPEEPHQLQLGSAHTESFYRSWADKQLARIQSSNSQSAHLNVMARLDMALRILSGLEMPEKVLGDPLDAIGREVFVSLGNLQDLGLEYKHRCLDTSTKIYSVTAAVFHDKYRKCIACMDEAVKAKRGLDKHQDIQPAIQHLHLAVHHARKAADGGFFTRAVAMYDALLSAVAEFQTRAGLEELGNMLDDPENGFGSPVCTLPACKSHSRVLLGAVTGMQLDMRWRPMGPTSASPRFPSMATPRQDKY